MESLTVTSSAFEPGGKIPARYTGYGADLSPELRLAPLAVGAQSVAVVMDDLDIPFIREYNHWVIWNLPAEVSIPEGIAPGERVEQLNGATQGIGYGKHRYRGPKPPFNRSHRYRFTVYVLDKTLALPATARKRMLLDAMRGHILQQGELIGKFK